MVTENGGAGDNEIRGLADDDSGTLARPGSDSPPLRRISELSDDSVGMYLQEIGKVGLLDRADEQALARQMEASKHLHEVETRLGRLQGRRPAESDYIRYILKQVCEVEELVDAIGSYLEFPRPVTISDLLFDTRIRQALDGKIRANCSISSRTRPAADTTSWP